MTVNDVNISARPSSSRCQLGRVRSSGQAQRDRAEDGDGDGDAGEHDARLVVDDGHRRGDHGDDA